MEGCAAAAGLNADFLLKLGYIPFFAAVVVQIVI